MTFKHYLNQLVLKRRSEMKFCMTAILATSVLLLIFIQIHLQTQPAEAGIVRDLKKAAFVLGSNRKRLYAIPMPVLLPVFVKRQKIYTQVPVVPRYIQRPHNSVNNKYHHLAGSEPTGSLESYASASAMSNSHEQQAKQYSSTGGNHHSTGAGASKYLSPLTQALGSAYISPIMSSQRELVNKLLSATTGQQAKIMPAVRPSALIASAKIRQQPNHSASESDPFKQSTVSVISGESNDLANSSSRVVEQVVRAPSVAAGGPNEQQAFLNSLREHVAQQQHQHQHHQHNTDLYRAALASNLLQQASSPHYQLAMAALAENHRLPGALMRNPFATADMFPLVGAESHLEAAAAAAAAGGGAAAAAPYEIQDSAASNGHELNEMAAAAAAAAEGSNNAAAKEPDEQQQQQQLYDSIQNARYQQAALQLLAREREEAQKELAVAAAAQAQQLGYTCGVGGPFGSCQLMKS